VNGYENRIAADGPRRFARGKWAMKAESVEREFGAESANVSPDEKKKMRERTAKENARREKMLNHKPSAGTLW